MSGQIYNLVQLFFDQTVPDFKTMFNCWLLFVLKKDVFGTDGYKGKYSLEIGILSISIPKILEDKIKHPN